MVRGVCFEMELLEIFIIFMGLALVGCALIVMKLIFWRKDLEILNNRIEKFNKGLEENQHKK